ncbi:hypothetical protein Amme1_00136 [Pseudomonas phage vB_PpuM-Amme-1]
MGLFSLKTNSALGAFTTGIEAISTYRKSGSLGAVTGIIGNTIQSRLGGYVEQKINDKLYRLTGDNSLSLGAIKSGLTSLGLFQGSIGNYANASPPIPAHSGYLQNVLDLQQVEWNTDQLWDIKLADANALPSYFQSWLPVIDIEEDAAHVTTRDFQMGPTTITIMEGTHAMSIQIVFLDDHVNSLFNYFTTWMNQNIGGSGGRIVPMGDAYKMLYIKKMSRQKDTVEIRPYKVVPSGTLTFSGKSQGDLSQYVLKLEVIGSPGATRSDLDPSGTATSLLKSAAGLSSTANSAIDRISTGLTTLQNDVSSAYTSAIGAVSSKFDSATSGISQSANNAINSGANQVASGYKSAKTSIGQFFS